MQDIPGTKGKYKATKSGKIYNSVSKKYLKVSKTSSGHLKAKLILDGEHRYFLVHRLIALTYIPNPKKLPLVNHKDGDKTNCKVSNLEWSTGSHNIAHATRFGLSYFKPRVDNTSGHVGVSKLKNGTYRVYINAGGKRVFSGKADSLKEAIKLRSELKKKYHSKKYL